MKVFKKVLFILLALSMVCCFVGCPGPNTPDEPDVPVGSDPIIDGGNEGGDVEGDTPVAPPAGDEGGDVEGDTPAIEAKTFTFNEESAFNAKIIAAFNGGPVDAAITLDSDVKLDDNVTLLKGGKIKYNKASIGLTIKGQTIAITGVTASKVTVKSYMNSKKDADNRGVTVTCGTLSATQKNQDTNAATDYIPDVVIEGKITATDIIYVEASNEMVIDTITIE